MKYLAAILFALALAVGQAMQGGAQMPALALPAYAIAGIAALFALPGAFRFPPAPVPLGLGLALFGFVVWRALQPGADPFLARIDLLAAFACGLTFVALAAGFPNSRSRAWLLVGCGAVLAAQLGIGLLQFTFGGDWMPAGWISDEQRLIYAERFGARTRGSFLNPNHMAWALGTGCILSLAFAIWGRVRIWSRIVFAYFAAVFLVGVILTASRGGILALGVGILVLGGLSVLGAASCTRKGSRAVLVGGALIIVLVTGAGFFVYESAWAAQSRFQEMLVPGVRTAFTEAAWRSFQDEPVLGAGPGEYLYAARDYRQPTHNGNAMYAHNDWLQLMAEYGWIGFSLAVLALFSLVGNGVFRFLQGLQSRLKEGMRPFSNESAVALGGVACAAFFATHSIVDFNFHIPANALLAAGVLGLLAGSPRPGPNYRIGLVRRRASICLVVIGFLVFGGGLVWQIATGAQADFAALKAKNHIDRGEAREALELLEPLVERYPSHPQLALVEARAIAGYEASLATRAAAASQINALELLDDASIENLDEAGLDALVAKVEALESITGLDPDESAAYQRRAVEAYSRAALLRPREREIHAERAFALASAGNTEAAEEASMEAIRLDFWSGYPIAVRAEIYEMAGARAEAMLLYELASRMPDGQGARARLLRMRAEDEVLRELEAEEAAVSP